jgi:mRNA-degrading endonuclease RelE of RelBE toxin-antitoxin system
MEPASAERAIRALEVFARTGAGQVKKLRDYEPPTWRLRIGELRILFAWEGGMIIVRRVLHRSEIYTKRGQR